MSKVIIFLIASAYIIYFLLTPPLTLHDEPAHVKIIVGVAQGKYISLGKHRGNFDDSKELGANKRIAESLQYIDHTYQIPTYATVSKLKKNENDYSIQDIYSHQAYSPPFYYVVGAAFYQLGQMLTPYLLEQFYYMRLTSTLFYLATVIIAWKILQVFIKDKKIASSILLFFAINPLVLKMGIGINPDIGVTFFSLCVFYLLLKLSSKEKSINGIAKVALLSAVATLTKISGIFTNVAFTLYILITNKFDKKSIRPILIFQGIFWTLTLPWFLFVFNRYGTFFPEPFSFMCPKPQDTSILTSVIETFTDFRFTLMQYSGFMGEGWPHPFEWFFASYVILFTVLLIFGLHFVWRQKQLKYKTSIIYIIPMFLFLIMVSAQYRLKEIDCDIPGRYMLPIFLILCLIVFWGLSSITKSDKNAALVLRAFAIFHFLFILFTVLLIRYYV